MLAPLPVHQGECWAGLGLDVSSPVKAPRKAPRRLPAAFAPFSRATFPAGFCSFLDTLKSWEDIEVGFLDPLGLGETKGPLAVLFAEIR